MYFHGKTIRIVFILAAFATMLNLPSALAWAGDDYAPGEIVLKLKSGKESIDCLTRMEIKPVFQNFHKEHARSASSGADLADIYLMKVPKGEETAYCETYRREPGVAYAEPNYLQHLCVSPNDGAYAQQWNLSIVEAESAWDLETGSEDVIVAVVDTGVDYRHPDLGGNLWRNAGEIADNGLDDDGNSYVDDDLGWDFVDASGGAAGEDFETPDNDPMDRHGHGTHVAGIAGAVSNNGIGIAGVVWNCKIMAVRAGYKTASGNGVLESDDAARAIVYAAENGAGVINLSWGDTQKSSLIEDAVRFAAEQGALVCAAAGNSTSESPLYPAALDNTSVMAIGSTDKQDKSSSFSNYGDWVHVSAPGTGIYSTYLNDAYTTMSGTSMATPHVAGLAGLVISGFSGLSPPAIKARIMRSVDILQDLAGKNVVSGRINAYTALSAQYATPHILSLSPNPVHEGDSVVLFGDHFGANQGSERVIFNPGLNGVVTGWTESSIACRVPEGIQTGHVSVFTGEGTSNEVDIAILPSFYRETLLAHEFQGGGVAQGWRADDQSWEFQLPFSFPFFGREYTKVYLCSNGYLDFSDSTANYLNSGEAFKTRVMIAPLWDDLVTHGSAQAGEDVYIDCSSGDAVCFRWVAEIYETGEPVNVAVILYRDGRVRFDYGDGNGGLSPTVGISGGGGEDYHFSVYDGVGQLREVESALFSPVEQTFTIALDIGWNLISLPLKPDNDQVGQVMGEVNGGIESVWGYENGVWYVYDPQNPGLSDLEIMKTGNGYWVKVVEEGLGIRIQGQAASQTLRLETGWNLIGFNSLQAMAVEGVFAEIEGEIESVWGYENGAWYVYDPQSPELSDLEEMEPGEGYWVSVK